MFWYHILSYFLHQIQKYIKLIISCNLIIFIISAKILCPEEKSLTKTFKPSSKKILPLKTPSSLPNTSLNSTLCSLFMLIQDKEELILKISSWLLKLWVLMKNTTSYSESWLNWAKLQVTLLTSNNSWKL